MAKKVPETASSTRVVVVNNKPWFNRVISFCKRRWLFLVVALLIVIAAAVLLLELFSTNSPANKTKASTTGQNMGQISSLVQQNKLPQAESALKTENTNQPSLSTALSLSNVQQAQYKYTDAVATLQAAQKEFGDSYLLLARLGEVEALAGNNTAAINYYNQAVKYVQSNPKAVASPQQTISQLQASITALQQEPK